MKIVQYVASVLLMMASFLLLFGKAHAAVVPATVFTPTRFTVVDEGTVGKPDVLLIPGLASSRAVFDAEAKLLAPNYRLHRLQVDGFAGQAAGANATGAILPAIVEEIHLYLAAGHLHPMVIGHSLVWAALADAYRCASRGCVQGVDRGYASLLWAGL